MWQKPMPVLLALIMCGCGTTPLPVLTPFPQPPQNLMSLPVPMQSLTEPATAVDALDNAVLNFGTCHANSQQLIDLQSWITQQEKVK